MNTEERAIRLTTEFVLKLEREFGPETETYSKAEFLSVLYTVADEIYKRMAIAQEEV